MRRARFKTVAVGAVVAAAMLAAFLMLSGCTQCSQAVSSSTSFAQQGEDGGDKSPSGTGATVEQHAGSGNGSQGNAAGQAPEQHSQESAFASQGQQGGGAAVPGIGDGDENEGERILEGSDLDPSKGSTPDATEENGPEATGDGGQGNTGGTNPDGTASGVEPGGDEQRAIGDE